MAVRIPEHRHLCVTVRVRLVSVLDARTHIGLGWAAALGWLAPQTCRVGVGVVAWRRVSSQVVSPVISTFKADAA